MDSDVLIGIIVVCLAYSFILCLILWSRKTIEFIAKRKIGSIREIKKEMSHGK